jgi:hypothetical protein
MAAAGGKAGGEAAGGKAAGGGLSGCFSAVSESMATCGMGALKLGGCAARRGPRD